MIHPTAVIHSSAQIDPSVEVGAYCVIDGPAKIAAGCRIESHAQIVGAVEIGEGTVIGRSAIIGGDPQDIGFDRQTPSGVVLGARNTIREHVTIHRGSKPDSVTRIGEGNFMMVGSHLAHDVILGDRNILANACLLGGHVRMGNGTFVGGGAAFHQFIRVGDSCVIQGTGGFSKDIPHFCAAYGVNRLGGLNVIGLRRQGFSSDQRAAIKEMFRLLFSSGRNLSQAIAAAQERQWPEPAQRLLDFVAEPSKKGICSLRRRLQAD
jgi:UDP-N-acetylglucosamine acyltransferase